VVGPVSFDDEGPLPSPASAIASLAREFEQSLDLRAATKGQYVVKPQVINALTNLYLISQITLSKYVIKKINLTLLCKPIH
jgi:hypothetical protein